MKKIVPFKKEINLENNIASINSISLEHTLEKKESNLITGDFIISGTYKMTQTSVNLDNFEYKLPVNITIDQKYNIDKVVIDINDFYYEVINDKMLSINIEGAVDNLEERKFEMEEKKEDKEEKETPTEIPEPKELEPVIKEEKIDSWRNEEVQSIFQTIDDNENYVMYKIHVVTENDTIEGIMEEYQTTRESLEAYNDLTNVKLGDKIIIADGN